jgi:uncharacterized protein HemX
LGLFGLFKICARYACNFYIQANKQWCESWNQQLVDQHAALSWPTLSPDSSTSSAGLLLALAFLALALGLPAVTGFCGQSKHDELKDDSHREQHLP